MHFLIYVPAYHQSPIISSISHHISLLLLLYYNHQDNALTTVVLYVVPARQVVCTCNTVIQTKTVYYNIRNTNTTAIIMVLL